MVDEGCHYLGEVGKTSALQLSLTCDFEKSWKDRVLSLGLYYFILVVLLSLKNQIHELFWKIGENINGSVGHLVVECALGRESKVLWVDCDFDEFVEIVQIFGGDETG